MELPLRDIQLPEAVSWWPPAPGWWLSLAALALIVITSWWFYRAWQQREVLRQLRAELVLIRQGLQQNDIEDTLSQLSILLRRACLSFFPRQQVAALTGENWLAFLNQHTANSFNDDVADLLTRANYMPASQLDSVQVMRLLDVVDQALPLLFRQAGRRA